MSNDDLPLSEQLEKMGFDKSTFMVVSRYERVVVGDWQDGKFVENEFASFGDVQKRYREDSYETKTTCEANDDAMLMKGATKGGIGSNNGLYSAQMRGGNELIITEDRDIYEALEKMGYKKCIGVPLSNGGEIKDYEQQNRYNNMSAACKIKADRYGEKDRTAAVQRGDIITTYDPNNVDSIGCYRNVRHYEQQQDGGLKPVSREYASHKLQLTYQYSSNEQTEINKGKQLDGQAISQMVKDKARYY